MNLKRSMDDFCKAQVARFRPYTFDHPMIMPTHTYEELRTLGIVIHKVIMHVAGNYEEYLDLMPFSGTDLKILEVCSQQPYRVGTFRTDFVIDEGNHIRIVEMTTRQPLNGYFLSGVLRRIAQRQIAEYGIDGIMDAYSRFPEYLQEYIGDATHICVVKGNERMGEFKVYPAIFENAEIACHIIPVEQLPDTLDLLKNAWVIEELNHREIRQLPLEVIDALTRARMHNDIRTILFAHDKRFFYLLGQSAVVDTILDPSERALLRKYLVPTYIHGKDASIWEDAYRNRDGYILKHQTMGKSERVYAGCVTDETTWKSLFDSDDVGRMVLQPFVQQRTFQDTIGDRQHIDYVAGTLLYFNQEFFGPGLFRASSFPVTNVVDDRKIAQLVATADQRIPGVHYI